MEVIDVPTRRHEGVLVVGGGYAGLHAVRSVEALGVAACVVDSTGHHDFVTRLAAVAGGTAARRDARQPLTSFARSVDVSAVESVGDGVVGSSDGRAIEADAIVVTAGSVPSRPPIEGIELARPLRTADDALGLREAIAAAPAVVIIGGGATGVQLAGSVAQAHPSILVRLVEAGSTLLPGLPTAMGRGAERILRSRGVEVHLGRAVEQIAADGVTTDAGELAGLTVWAGGFSADASRLGLPTTDDGRLALEPDLRVPGFERVFAAGDIAAHVDRSGRPLPMSAQIAVRAGTIAGRNAARVVRGEPTDDADLGQLGWVLDLGGRRGLAQVGPIVLGDPITDLVPPLLHDLIDLKNLVEIGGVHALRFAPTPVRSLIPHMPGFDWLFGDADSQPTPTWSPTTS